MITKLIVFAFSPKMNVSLKMAPTGSRFTLVCKTENDFFAFRLLVEMLECATFSFYPSGNECFSFATIIHKSFTLSVQKTDEKKNYTHNMKHETSI